MLSSSFSTKRINRTTFVVREDDAFGEHPFIYVKLHPEAPVIILSDTGCDEPSEKKQHARFIYLRDYLENCPIKCNKNAPLNPKGTRQYIIVCTHCHYDHIGGISQFLAGGTTEIIASAAGRDFIESDLDSHSLSKYVGKITPYYNVTHWAQAFERLYWPVKHEENQDVNMKPVDLGITFIQTPGHTPDSLAWYDHHEMHLYVGDSMYEEGEDGMAVIWVHDSNFVEWAFSMQKLQYFIKSENARAASIVSEDEDGWTQVARRVKLGAGHQTHSADAEEFSEMLEKFWWAVVGGDVPVIKKEYKRDEVYFTWRERDGKSALSLQAPPRLMDEARRFFKGTGMIRT